MKEKRRAVVRGVLLILLIVIAVVPTTAWASSETELKIPITARIGGSEETEVPSESTEESTEDITENSKESTEAPTKPTDSLLAADKINTPSAVLPTSGTTIASGVKTGDQTNASSYLILLLSGIVLLLIIVKIKGKKDNHQNHPL